MLIICIVVALLVSALMCLVVMGHHIERQRQNKIMLDRLIANPPEPTQALKDDFNRYQRAKSADGRSFYFDPGAGKSRYDDTEPVNPLHIAAPYPTPSRSDDCAFICVDMAEAADRTVVHHCSAPSSYSHGGSDSYGGSSDGGYSSSSCDSSSSSSGCD